MKKNIIKIITPPVAEDQIDCDLVNLTETIWNVHHAGERYCYGLGGEFGYGVNFKNDIFEMFPYYWGECTCGIEEAMGEKEIEWCNANPHSEDCFDTKLSAWEKEWETRYPNTKSGEVYIKALDTWCKSQGQKGYGGCVLICTCGRNKRYTEWSNKFLNDFHKTNVDQPYYHAPTCLVEKPNFIHFKSGLEIRWYKWIGRDTEINQDLTIKEWNQIYQECLNSLI